MSKKLFTKDTTYDDIKSVLSKKLVTYYDDNTKALVQNGLASLVLLKDKERVVTFIQRVDEIYTKENLEKQKLPTILTGMILLYSYKDFTEKLSNDALTLLSHNISYCFTEVDEIKASLDCMTPKILETIVTKTKSYTERDSYYNIAETLFIDCNKPTIEAKENYVSDRIKNMKEDEFNELDKYNCEFTEIEKISEKIGIKI